MAIVCPACGREYDISLFQFGRTLHCDCGVRVGLEKRIGAPVDIAEPRFLADAMLGGLARWLRLLGFDTLYDPSLADEEMVKRSLTQGRYILTRDRRLHEEWRIDGIVFVEEKRVEAQLRAVLARFHLRDRLRPFTRCSRCNTPLEQFPLEREPDDLRPPARRNPRSMARCPGCGRIYWEGSHTRRMRLFLAGLLR